MVYKEGLIVAHIMSHIVLCGLDDWVNQSEESCEFLSSILDGDYDEDISDGSDEFESNLKELRMRFAKDIVSKTEQTHGTDIEASAHLSKLLEHAIKTAQEQA